MGFEKTDPVLLNQAGLRSGVLTVLIAVGMYLLIALDFPNNAFGEFVFTSILLLLIVMSTPSMPVIGVLAAFGVIIYHDLHPVSFALATIPGNFVFYWWIFYRDLRRKQFRKGQ